VTPSLPRILFVSAALNVGGAERQWAVLIPMLRSRGYETSVLTLLGRGHFFEELAAGGERVEYADLGSRFDLPGLARLVSERHPSDLVVSQSFAGQVAAHAIARRSSVPHVTTEHLPPDMSRRAHERALLRALAPRFDATIAVTRAQIGDLEAVGYPTSRIRVIPNGVAELSPVRSVERVRAEFGFADDTFVAVLAAALRRQKRAERFVEAVVLANRTNSRIRGLVVGNGPDMDLIRPMASASNGVVQVAGQRADVVDILAMADAVCLTSDAEALPMVVLEAMALGRPVVATSVGGVPEAVTHEQTGLLVPLCNADAFAGALVRLADDRKLASNLGRAGEQRWSEQFTAERMADRYALFFESLAGIERRDDRSSVSDVPERRASDSRVAA
jgi:glycosyltransferase involved in cell wall biosynthesis